MENEEIDLIEVMAKLWHRKKTIMYIALFFLVGGLVLAFFLPRKYTAQCTLGLEMEDRDYANQCRRNVAFPEYADGGYAEYAYCFAGYVSGYFFQCTFSERVDLFSFIHR